MAGTQVQGREWGNPIWELLEIRVLAPAGPAGSSIDHLEAPEV